MKLNVFFENVLSFFKELDFAQYVANVKRKVARTRRSVNRVLNIMHKYVSIVLNFFFAEETIEDIKKVGKFFKKIIRIVARIAAIPCFFIGLVMILTGSSLGLMILGFFIMMLPKHILKSGQKKVTFVTKIKEAEYEHNPNSDVCPFAAIKE